MLKLSPLTPQGTTNTSSIQPCTPLTMQRSLVYSGALQCSGFPLAMQRRIANIGILHCSLSARLSQGSVACRHAISQPLKVCSLHYHTQPTATREYGTDLRRHSPCAPAGSALLAFCRSQLVTCGQFKLLSASILNSNSTLFPARLHVLNLNPAPSSHALNLHHPVPSTTMFSRGYISNLNPTQFTAMLRVSNLNLAPFSTVFSRGYISRAITIALKKHQEKIVIPKAMQVIDEEGNNLGVMSSDTVLKLAESKNLSLSEVRKPSEDALAVYRLYTRKQHLEEDKKKKVANKKNPKNVTKDMILSTRIEPFHLNLKISRMKKFLEKQHAVRVFVQTRYTRGMREEEGYTRGMREEEEEAARCDLVKNIEKQLEGLGSKMMEDRHSNRQMVCTFKSNL